MLKITAFWLLMLVIPGIALAGEKIYIIVNKNVPEKKIEKESAIDIFTLNRQHWSDGTKIVPVDYKGNNELKTKYYEYLGISYQNMQKIWLKKQFSGKATPPATYKSEEEIIDEVGSTPGAVGYVSTSKLNKDVRIVAVIEL